MTIELTPTVESTVESTVRSTTADTPAVPSRAEALRGLAGGTVHLPGGAGYDTARMPWSAAVDQRPAAVAHPRTVAEVATVVRAARDAGLRVAPQRTGHNAAPLAARGLDDVVLLRTSAMDAVSVDPQRRVARVEGGALWLPAVEAAGRPRPGRPARLLTRRRHRRLLARGRHRLVRPQARAGHQQPHRCGARPRRRLARARRCPQQPRALLGRPRWRRQLRGRHGTGVPALPDRHGIRGHARLGRQRRRARAAALGPLGARGTRRGHHGLPHPPRAAAAGDPRAAAWPHPRRHRRRGARLRRLVGLRAGRAARARTGAGHLRPRAGSQPGAAAQGPRGPDARRLRKSRPSGSQTSSRRKVPGVRPSATAAPVPGCAATTSANASRTGSKPGATLPPSGGVGAVLGLVTAGRRPCARRGSAPRARSSAAPRGRSRCAGPPRRR